MRLEQVDGPATLSLLHYANDDALGQGPVVDALWAEAMRLFRSPKRQREWVASRLLMGQMGIDPAKVSHRPSGKPYLTDDSRHISLSHTLGHAAVILSPRPVGVDIERFSTRVHRVAARFMEPDFPLPPADSDEATWMLLLHWSAKEALFKCMDEEGIDFAQHLHIQPFTLQTVGTMLAYETKTPRRQTFDVYYRIGADYVLTYTLSPTMA